VRALFHWRNRIESRIEQINGAIVAGHIRSGIIESW